jgi:MFS family permease
MSSAPALQQEGSRGYVYVISMIAAVGGLLFGFDTGIISGAIGPVVKEFRLTEWQEGWAVSAVLVGCIIGASFAGKLSDWRGRKKILIATALLYTVSAVLSAFPRNLTELVLARFLGGLAVGLSSMVSPIYIAEIAPARIRGRLVSLQQMAIVSGLALSYFISWLLVDIGPNNWRWMFASQAFPALALFMALFFVPESPRWLTQRGEGDRALSILARVGGETHARAEMAEIEEALVPAFIIEEFEDGRFSVFVPSAPTPFSGSVYILTPERVHPVDIPFTHAIKALSRWGSGSKELVAAMKTERAA